jgi:hypothetical protein
VSRTGAAAAALLVQLLSGCAGLSSGGDCPRAGCADWARVETVAEGFSFVGFTAGRAPATDHLVIYLEGDGRAWSAAGGISPDPTPVIPLALDLALNDPWPDLAYLARPCQFVRPLHGCHPRYWSTARFAPEVIAAYEEAIAALKAARGARRLTLVGYSGGGAVAALIAARRNDVDSLITIAAPLDHVAWTAWHGLTPLSLSLNPADMARALGRICQLHLVGGADRNVPPLTTIRFTAELDPAHARLVELPGFDHDCCWLGSWRTLLATYRRAGSPSVC